MTAAAAAAAAAAATAATATGGGAAAAAATAATAATAAAGELIESEKEALDLQNLERHLTESDFLCVFGKTKEDFVRLAGGSRRTRRRRLSCSEPLW